jgi:hypothetical protein
MNAIPCCRGGYAASRIPDTIAVLSLAVSAARSADRAARVNAPGGPAPRAGHCGGTARASRTNFLLSGPDYTRFEAEETAGHMARRDHFGNCVR